MWSSFICQTPNPRLPPNVAELGDKVHKDIIKLDLGF